MYAPYFERDQSSQRCLYNNNVGPYHIVKFTRWLSADSSLVFYNKLHYASSIILTV